MPIFGGGGVSQSTLDAAVLAAVPVGTIKAMHRSTAPTGWIFATGSIGSATSGATTRANADTEDLYTLIYGAYADGQAAVAGGRGASAAADFAANKALTMPDVQGRVLVGRDNMSGSAAGRIASGDAHGVNGQTLGAAGGVGQHAITEVELRAHSHITAGYDSVWQRDNDGATTSLSATGSSVSDQPVTPATIGSSAAHTNLQPSLIVNYFVKL